MRFLFSGHLPPYLTFPSPLENNLWELSISKSKIPEAINTESLIRNSKSFSMVSLSIVCERRTDRKLNQTPFSGFFQHTEHKPTRTNKDHTRRKLKTILIQGDVNGVNKLLESGDIESPDQMMDLKSNGEQRTLLMWACRFYYKHHDISLIRDLVKNHNANVNVQGAHGLTAVMFAIAGGLVSVLRFLVEEGCANLELRTRHGSTPLHVACGHDNKNEDIVRCLLEHHAYINAADQLGRTPLHYAAFCGNCSIARLLLADDRVNMEAINEKGCTPLHIVCHTGNVEIVELLLSNGANPNAVDENRWTPLLYAVGSGNTACVHALMKAKLDVNTGDSLGLTALHRAVIEGNVDVVELLLKARADWSAKEFYGHTPVDMVKEEHREPVETLFVETLSGMVREHEVFRSTVLRGITQEACSLKTLVPDVVPHIAGYCNVPMGDELDIIRLELDRLCLGRRGRKRSGCTE